MPQPTHRDFRGAAIDGRVSGAVGTGDATITLKASPGSTGWPDGPSECVIDPGLSTEEQVIFTSRSGLVLSGVSRGQNNSVAVAHSDNAVIRHVGTKRDFQESNDHTSDTEADPHATKLLNTTRHDLTARHTVGSVIAAGTALDLGDTTSGSANSVLRSDARHGFPAATAYTPAWGGTVGNGTLNGRYIKVGKMLWVSIELSFGSTTTQASGTVTFGLPPGITTIGRYQELAARVTNIATGGTAPAFAEAAANITFLTIYMAKANGTTPLQGSISGPSSWPGAWGVTDFIVITGWLEIA